MRPKQRQTALLRIAEIVELINPGENAGRDNLAHTKMIYEFERLHSIGITC